MTSQHTTIYTPFADGRPVRDIVEHTPALVDEPWCRNLLRHVLDSLEQQYASGAPHRAITPDTLVVLANGEALLMPSVADASATQAAPGLPADLQALALVVHYAITAELPPEGPLGPRLYDNYSEQLTKGLDCCLGPNRRLRPQTVADMRALLGIEAGAATLPAAPVADTTGTVPAPDVFDAPPQEARPAPAAPVPVLEAAGFLGEATPAGGDAAAPAILSLPGERPVAGSMALDGSPDAPAPSAPPQEGSGPYTSEPVNLRELAAAGMLRKSATRDAAADKFSGPPRAAERIGAAPPPAGPAPAAQHKPSAAIPLAPRAGTSQAQPAQRRDDRVQRWGMIAGAAIVVLAAGGALVSYLQQNDTRDLAPFPLLPQERAATGLDAGETVVAPPAATADPATGAAPFDGAPATIPNAAPAPAPAAGVTNDAVINGTTYKLLIKPWGTIYVNGVDRGVSPPVKRLTLGPGQHTIRLANPNFPEHIMTVEAGMREIETIEHDFTAQAE